MTAMRLIYADPGLKSIGGHHLTACENITAQARARGIETRVYGNADMTAHLREHLSATPLFRGNPTKVADDDPFCGFMNACFEQAAWMSEDLAKIPGLGSTDLIYMPSAQGAQMLGLGEWLGGFAGTAPPAVVVNLNFQPGLVAGLEGGKRVWFAHNPHVDPRAHIYRFAAHHLKAFSLPRLHVVTEHPDWVETYSELLLRKVHLLSTLPFDGPKAPFKRGARKRLTIVTLGHQWEHKGFHLIPEVFEHLLTRTEKLRLVAHNSNPNPQTLPETRAALAAMAARDERVINDNRVLNAETYQALLDAADLVLCPYNPDRYRSALSGVVSEAVANGIPVIVPADTSMAADLAGLGTGETFTEFTAPSIAAAAARVLDDFDSHATRALASAERWSQERGCSKFVDEILAITAARGAA